MTAPTGSLAEWGRGAGRRLRAIFTGLAFEAKIRVLLVASLTVLGGAIALVGYGFARGQALAHAHESLSQRAMKEGAEGALRLGAALAVAEAVASNLVTANALADTEGRETYLGPLLASHRLPIAGTTLSVIDYRGRLVAGAVPPSGLPEASPEFRDMMRDGRAQARYDVASRELVVLLPVVYRLTGRTEGGVAMRLPLAALLEHPSPDSRRIEGGDGSRLAGRPSPSDAVEARAALRLAPPLDGLGLQIVVARESERVTEPLRKLLAIFLALSVAGLVLADLLARAAARLLAAPLRQIAGAAESIARAEWPRERLEVRHPDAFGRLAAAFNTMAERVRASHEDLERRVRERTVDYESSRAEAAATANLLSEAVASVAVGIAIFDARGRLVLANDAWLDADPGERSQARPGTSYTDLTWRAARGGRFPSARGVEAAWVESRLRRHREADGRVHEEQVSGDRWLLESEKRTPSGHVVANRIDVTDLRRAMAALGRRELCLRATMDNLPYQFWLKDRGGSYLAVNRAFADAFGAGSPEEVVGRLDADLLPASRVADEHARDADVMGARRGFVAEERDAGNGGAERWFEVYRGPVVDANGGVAGVAGYRRDITDRRRIERALAESEERWDLALRGANDGVWDWNVRTGQAYFSERWARMLGHRPGELAGEIGTWRSRLHPSDGARVMDSLERHLARESDHFEAEYRMRCRDGSYKWVLSRGKALFDEHGQPVRMAGSHTDITDRHEAASRLRERTEQLNAVLALSPAGFVSFDAAGRVAYASPAFARLTGIAEAEVAGLDEAAFAGVLVARCHPGTPFPGMDALRATARAGSSSPRHLVELSGPTPRVLEVALSLPEKDGAAQLLSLRDVTPEAEVDRMKSEFLSTAAHELRTPMASVLGFAELLLAEDYPEPERREYLCAIHDQSRLIVSIVNELLDLARIEARRGKDFDFATIDLGTLLAEAAAAFGCPPGREPPVLRFPDRRVPVRADGRKLRQALGNLLSNAYKYSPDGGEVVLELVTGEGGGTVAIRVRDRGIGLTPEQAERVWDRFYRADRSGRIPGTGLGMSIVREIVQFHGGEVGIESEPGRGTTVTVWLPAQVREPAGDEVAR